MGGQRCHQPHYCAVIFFFLSGYNCTYVYTWHTIIHINSHVYFLVIQSEISFTALNWDGEMYAWTVGFSVEYLRERIFVTVILWEVHDGVLNPKLAFLTINHCNGHVNAQNSRCWSSINMRHTFGIPLQGQKIDVLLALLLHE